eukprot:5128705-Pyramimonas_sp.AAC.3
MVPLSQFICRPSIGAQEPPGDAFELGDCSGAVLGPVAAWSDLARQSRTWSWAGSRKADLELLKVNKTEQDSDLVSSCAPVHEPTGQEALE